MDRAIPISVPESVIPESLGGDSAHADSLTVAEQLARGHDPDHALQAARIFSLEGQRERAIDILRQAIVAHPKHAALLVTLADLLSRSGTFEEADLLFRQALEYAPADAESWYRRGLHESRQGRLDAARESYEESVRLDPSRARAWVNLGLVRADLADRAGAIKALLRAVQADPSCAEAHSNLGVLYHEGGMRAEGTEAFRRAVALAPDSSEAHFNLGWALLGDMELEPAEQLLEASVRLDAQNVESLYALALLHLRVGKTARAVASLRQAVELKPDDGRLHYQLGVAYDKKELPVLAREAYRRAAALNG